MSEFDMLLQIEDQARGKCKRDAEGAVLMRVVNCGEALV